MSQDDAPVAGVMVEFARSVAGQTPDYQWSGMTDDMGRVTLEISGQVTWILSGACVRGWLCDRGVGRVSRSMEAIRQQLRYPLVGWHR